MMYECHRSPINAGYLALDKFYIDDGFAIIAYAVAPVYTNTTNPHHHLTKSGPEVPMLITCRSICLSILVPNLQYDDS